MKKQKRAKFGFYVAVTMLVLRSIPALAVTTQNTPGGLPPQTQNFIGQGKAEAIALKHAGVRRKDVQHIFTKMDHDYGKVEYDIEFWARNREYSYDIHAITGQVVSSNYEILNQSNDVPHNANTGMGETQISVEKAKSIALRNAGINPSTAQFIHVEYDYEDGFPEYDLEWYVGRMKYEYTVRATDGMITERKIDIY